MKISDVRELLKDKRVIEEINRHLWIESQKAGYSIGIERATDEWLRLYAQGWMKYHMPAKYRVLQAKKKKEELKKKKAAKAQKARKKVSKTKKRVIKKTKTKKSSRSKKAKRSK